MGKGMKKKIIFLLLALFVFVSADDRDSFFEHIQNSVITYKSVDSYKSLNIQKERIDGEVIEKEDILFKYKQPHLVYMKHTKGNEKGSEVIYNKAAYGDNIVYHAGGLFGAITLELDPKGSLVKKGNRHLIYDAGIGHIIALLNETAEHIKKGVSAEVVFVKNDVKHGEKLKMYQLTSKSEEIYSEKVVVGFRAKDSFPVYISVYNNEGALLEEYLFKNLDYSTKLSTKEFDKENTEYNF